MSVYIAPIVEGHTEQRCLERLLQRIWGEFLQRPERLQVLEPYRDHRDALIHPNGQRLRDTVQKTFLKLRAKTHKDIDARSLVLILLDAEKDPACQLAPRLLEQARQARSDARIACIMPVRMLENWIVAGAASLGGVNGLPNVVQPPVEPEQCSGVAWLSAQIRGVHPTRKYEKTVDAAAFVQRMDLARCRAASPSFDKLCRDLEAFVTSPLPTTNSDQPASDVAPGN